MDQRRDERLHTDDFLAVAGLPIWTRFYLVDLPVRLTPIHEQRLLNLCTTLQHNEPPSPVWREALADLCDAGASGVTALLSSDLDIAKCLAALSAFGEQALAPTVEALRKGDDRQRLVAATVICIWEQGHIFPRADLRPDLERAVNRLRPRDARKSFRTWLDEICSAG